MTSTFVVWLLGVLQDPSSPTVPGTNVSANAVVLAFIAMMGTVLVAAIPAYFSYRASLSSKAAAKEARSAHDEITTASPGTAGQQIETLTTTLEEVQRQQGVTQRQVNAVLGILADMQIEDAAAGQPHLKPSDIIRIINQQERA